ncbi:1,4-dihydroxy-2-naphthoate octaprenyltransferase [Fodinicola feengrottensis]|uniref:1,4-dihydroxy-2-naphthoate octaprenyltransferase n=1 Tax=Fodinicola feengrottensis TaxID=435914 RepID=UPI00244191FD|nr:1,4-dihydroxy-2-naphthoate octaprenyltransferase [Fodinicola feengrottensis]
MGGGGPAADPAGVHLRGDRGRRRRRRAGLGGFSLWRAAARAGGGVGAAGGRQLCERLFRRHPRYGREPSRPVPVGRQRVDDTGHGEVRGVRLLRGAAIAGLALVIATQAWWLLIVGIACIAAAWYYTGGRRPYGYRALGEVFVFIFFGPVAVLGTTYVQALRLSWPAIAAAAGIGCYACAILVANNVRDIPTDAQTGKKTLAVMMGDPASRTLWAVLVGFAHLLGILLAVILSPWVWFSLIGIPMAVRAAGPLLAKRSGLELIPTLRDTGLAELLYAVGLGVGLALSV